MSNLPVGKNPSPSSGRDKIATRTTGREQAGITTRLGSVVTPSSLSNTPVSQTKTKSNVLPANASALEKKTNLLENNNLAAVSPMDN